MIYWWIERRDGRLAIFGREVKAPFVITNPLRTIVDTGCPHLFRTKKEAQMFCRPGERPVKVKVERVIDKEAE